jgi:tetratricopeptide (TPR) repeat protein
MLKTKNKQIILTLAILLLGVFLFSKDIKGLVKPKENGKTTPNMAQDVASSAATVTIDEVSATAKNLISLALNKDIVIAETEYKKASEANKTKYAAVLAKKWDDVEQQIPSAMYLEVIAISENTTKNWLTAGNQFLKAFENTRDSLIQPQMLLKANNAYTKALALDSTNTDAKTGLGVTIVNGLGAPMAGITMLLEVVKKEPKNLKANMNLGTFAIKSGQFDKAIKRFNLIISTIKPTPDAYFYLATAYENLGKNKEAIEAYLNSKKLAANTTLSSFIDKKVAELKNKR